MENVGRTRPVQNLRIRKRWKVSPPDKELQAAIGKELGILPVTAQVLINRGISDPVKARLFFSPDLNNLHDPFLMKDMDAAVGRIIAAMNSGERIAVYGDYDVDGTTSTALLYLFFKEAGVDVVTHIPERKTEGYGVNAEAVKKLHSKGVKLIITVDCGTSNRAEVELASSLGVDFVVTDHHEISDGGPGSVAFLNPMRKDCAFPFKGLAGVGVAFNLVVALRARLRESGWFKAEPPNLKKYLDIVAVGTVADMVPLVDENRVLVSHGLKELSETKRPGLKALKDAAGLKNPRVTADNIAFQLAPRINAAGRLERADTALKLFITGDTNEAAVLARKLSEENSSRQAIEAAILGEALAMASDGPDKAMVLCREGWHQGVIGIVASRLVERFSKPVVVLAPDGDIARGSVRGVRGMDIMDGIKACAGLLERFGGHKAAAGISVRTEKVEEFRRAYIDHMNSSLDDEDLVPEVRLDAVVPLKEVDSRLVEELDRLAPFGHSNEKPLFCIEAADIVNTEVVKDRHLRMTLKHEGRTQNAIAFGMAGLHPVRGPFDIAFYPYVDQWNGVRSISVSIKEVKSCG